MNEEMINSYYSYLSDLGSVIPKFSQFMWSVDSKAIKPTMTEDEYGKKNIRMVMTWGWFIALASLLHHILNSGIDSLKLILVAMNVGGPS